MKSIGIIGTGFVGQAMISSFNKKNINIVSYDKYKPCNNSLCDVLECDFVFLCLPTPYSSELKSYDKSAIEEICQYLKDNCYQGCVVVRSTIEPGSTNILCDKYNLNMIHNPEFLTARTADKDYHNQKHIVFGAGKVCNLHHYNKVIDFMHNHYPQASISRCTSLESECVKIFANSFYAVKVQFFTEMYLLCNNIGCSYDHIKEMLIQNDWINSMHTNVPGPDGNISYGGLCFPKDTNALNDFMRNIDTPNGIIQACINERNLMRDDNDNCS